MFLTVLLSFKSFSITSINISFCSGSRLEEKINIYFYTFGQTQPN